MSQPVNKNAKLKLYQIAALYIGAVLGSGILILPGVAAEIAGPASLAAWGLMSLLILPMSLTIGLLSSQYPNDGGVAYFVAKAFNEKLGSLVGWFFAMAVLMGAPVIALTGSGYFCSALGLEDSIRLIMAGIILLTALIVNYYGMRLTSQVQVSVVVTTLAVLIFTVFGSFNKIEALNFQPFIPYGPFSIGSALTILFWCFLGWEAVANFTSDFKDPKKDAVRGAILASLIISIVYFFTAFVVVGTKSYGLNVSDVALVFLIKNNFGSIGAFIAGFAALFICMAPCIAYVGAVSRLLSSLSESGFAPKVLSFQAKKRKTPLGALLFCAVCFTIMLIVFSTRLVSMATLVQIPNATFILTYIGAGMAGVRLLKNIRYGVLISSLSLFLSCVVFLFAGWSILYPLFILCIWLLTVWKKR